MSVLPRILAQLPALSGEELEELAAAVTAEQASRFQGQVAEVASGRITYRQEWVTCGKKDCHCMTGGAKHGPYYYAYFHKDGRVRSRYIGKTLPEDIEERLRGWREGGE